MTDIRTIFFPTTLNQEHYKRDDTDLPTLTNEDSFTTPAISVPPSNNNPYLLRQNNPSGTVFIAVGAIVGAILLGFVLYHLIKSIIASRLAKRTIVSDKQLYEKYKNNNNTAYGSGITPVTSFMNSEYQSSVAKLPLLSHHPSRALTGLGGGVGGTFNGSQAGDTSTIYASETGGAISKNDLTKMFFSPTAEVMQHKRVKSSQLGGSTSNLSIFGGSTTNLGNPSPATNRHSQLVPNLYINNEANNSDFSVNSRIASQQKQSYPSSLQAPRSTRKTIPSMYLEDLIDDQTSK